MRLHNNHIVRHLAVLITVLLSTAVTSYAQLPVRAREVQLISNNNTNYTRLQAVNGQTTNWTLTYPPTVGATGSMLFSTVTGATAATSWLAPANDGDVLSLSGGTPTWLDVPSIMWVLAGNPIVSSWNGTAGSFLGTTTTQPLSIATTNAIAQDINFYTGVSGANLRMTISGAGNITLNGTAGTPNVTLTSVGGAANATIPVGYDRILISDATGSVSQTSFNASAWTLIGNSGTTPATNFLGTTDAQDLVLRTNNTERLRVNATGEIGIGTTAAAGFDLHVAGTPGTPNVRLDASGGAVNLVSPVGYDRYLISNATGDVDQVSFQTAAELTSWTLLGNSGTSPLTNFLGTIDAQDLVLRTTNVERLRVNATGEVGIGTTAAAGFDLHVAGTPGTPNVRLDASGGAVNLVSPVGYDRYLISNATGDVDQVSFQTAAELTSWTLLGNSGTSPLTNFLGTIDAQDLVLRTTNIERLRVNATGELGVGVTAAAGYSLHVGGTAGTPNVRLDATGGAVNASIPATFDRLIISNATGDINQTSYDALVTAYTWLLAGNATTTAWNGLAGSFLGTTSTQPMSIATTNLVPQDINFYTGISGADLRMTIGSTGDITLGGTAGTPNVTLTSVSGVANAAIPVGYDRVLLSNAAGNVSQTTFAAAAAVTSWALLGNTGTNPATNFLGTTDAQPLVVRTNNTERLRVNATGEVGIGTTATAGYALHVGGVAGTTNIRATSLSANSAAPIVAEGVVTADNNGDLQRRSASNVLTTLGIGRGIFTPVAAANTFTFPTTGFDLIAGATVQITVSSSAVGPAVHAMVTSINGAGDLISIVTSATIDATYSIHWMIINP